MDDYIRREDAIEFVSSLVDTMSVCINKDECIGMKSMKSRAISALRDVPAADVRENVRGEWKHTEAVPHKVYCSACFATYLHNEKWATELPLPIHPNFCPNCNADMRGGENDG